MSGAELATYLHGKRVGTVARAKNGSMRFSYSPDIVERLHGAPLLSCALPVRAGAFDAETTRRWFEGLLPEDERLRSVQRFFGVTQEGCFPILEQIGWECAGAVTILPPDTLTHGDDAPYLELSAESLAARLVALPNHPYDTDRTLRVSLGGFQEKLCVAFPHGFTVSGATVEPLSCRLPLDGRATTHLLKPEPSHFPHLAQGEAWAMRVASAAVPTARASLLDLEGAPQTLVVERYDRLWVDGEIKRIHQEDCAQALGLAPMGKYASVKSAAKSDPTYRGIAELLVRHAEMPFEQLADLLKQLATNMALGNTDAHAKNYALVHPNETTVALAPMYDVVPSIDFIPQTRYLGMRIDGQITIDKIERAHVVAEAVSWGIPRQLAESLLDDTLYALEDGLEAAAELYPRAAARHEAGVRERIARLRR